MQSGSLRTFQLACVGGILLWLSFPPLGWWPLAWVAPIFWITIAALPSLPGRRPYWQLYAAGGIHWLLTLQWVRLPHWSAYFGWLALAGYLAVYLPLFVWLVRTAVHRWRIPVVVAAPVVWCGLELLRLYLLSGFSIALLAHTQVAVPQLIQLADIGGAYAVGFVMMLSSSIATRSIIHYWQDRRMPLSVVLVPAIICAVWLYGSYAMQGAKTQDRTRVARVGVIQGVVDTTFEDPHESRKAFEQYLQLSQRFVAEHGEVDLILWPESMFTYELPWITYETPLQPPPEWQGTEEEFTAHVSRLARHSREKARYVTSLLRSPILVGSAADHLVGSEDQRYNAALWFDADGRLLGQYHKMHPVMFGEYVPLGNIFPWLYHLTPMGSGLTPGRQPLSIDVGPLKGSTNICYENTVPHLVRRQLEELRRSGQQVDMMITLSNDGWFWGSSELDLHLACGIFRAVENRCPALVAANTGFSAWIDADGRLEAVGKRHATDTILATVAADSRRSLYGVLGDWPAAACLAFSLVLGLSEVWTGRAAAGKGPKMAENPA
ncbi:MAG: apolipoprotein N-acyltransferase [Pirellulaceae bacterium]